MLTERLIEEFTSDHPLHDLARYHLSSGGKCLRGRLVLAEGQHLGLDAKISLKWALACELLHNATLIHDDIQDNDPIRRGRPSLWKKAGIPEAINTGDFMIFRAFNLAAQLEDFRLTQILSETSELLVHGQMDELESLTHNDGNYWDSYQQMAKLKTGSLFLLPVHGTHLLAQQTMDQNFKNAWLHLGLCYQIFDDIRDFFGLKQVGQQQKDLDERRINALVAFLSTQKNYQSLIADYLISANTKDEQARIRQELSRAIENERIVEKLEALTQQILTQFKKLSSKPSQEIIFQYLNKALVKRT